MPHRRPLVFAFALCAVAGQTGGQGVRPAPSTRPVLTTRPAAPATRRSGAAFDLPPATRPAVATTRRAGGPYTAPAADPYAAARFRVDVMRVAADELGLAADVRARVADRLTKARAEADAAGPGGDAAVLARLGRDLDTLLGGDAARFRAHAEQVVGEVRDWGRVDNSGLRKLIDLIVQPEAGQRARLDAAFADAGRKAGEAAAGAREGMDARRQAAGFAARAAVRAALTPGQLKEWDESTAPTQPAPARTPETAAAEAEAAEFAWLEGMRTAAAEGPYPADQRAKLLARIERLRADIRAAAAEPITPKSDPTAKKIDALRQPLTLDELALLGGAGARDFDGRLARINGQIRSLGTAELFLDHTWLGNVTADLSLTPAQEAAVDRILSDRVAKLKAVDAAATPQDAPAVVRTRKDQIAFATRAALRAALTPAQLKAWDEAAGAL